VLHLVIRPIIQLTSHVEGEPVKGGWARAYWVYQPNAQLSQQALVAVDQGMRGPVAAAAISIMISDAPRTPVEVFPRSPEVVIALVKELAPHQRP
jgi:hypothetical protein